MMHTDSPGTHFYLLPLGGSVAVSFFALFSAATISLKFCEMFHVDDSYFADGGNIFHGSWRILVKTGVVER